MFKSIAIRFGKKYILKGINELLEKNKDNVSYVCQKIEYWIDKLNVIIQQLNRINDRCKDGLIEDQEVEDSIAEIETIVKEW